ncbi:hypothetical protein VB618_19345 [Microvirga sp. CF3062]|uniref:hypothetical protein n=1 Tax=Microvirga sp. CF3062 TaxID=3110182 RepID=UPI002E75AE65|nr:hypothetical protein [Microvirga sp. CF3062]MEE1658359.1 hypothetical protein [Microvirga sp. CF3062]
MATLVLSSNTLAENAEAGALVGTLSVAGEVVEGETFTFILEDERFQIINGNQLVVKAGSFDFEGSQKQFTLNIQVTGSQGTQVEAVPVVINLTNVNEAPTDILVTGGTIGDNAILGATVATLAGQDPDRGDLLTYTIVEDETGTAEYDHPYFGVSGSEIVVKSDLYDAPIGSMPVYVKVTDAKGLSYVKQVSLTVTPVNEAPEVSAEPIEVLDGSKGGILVAVISAGDPEGGPLTYKLSTGSAQWFTLIDNGDSTWNVVVKQGITLRSDRTAFQSFVIEVSDDANNTTLETVFLNINENLEPEATFEFLEVEKNTPAGTLVGTLVGYDPEGQTVEYILSGESAGLFTLVKNASGTYGVFVKQGAALDYMDEAQRSFTVTVSDGFNSFEESFELVFGNTLPKTTFTPISVKEGGGAGTVIGKLAATDFDGDELIYSLSDASAELFDLVQNSNGGYDVVVRAGVILDYENEDHRSLEVEVSDSIDPVVNTLLINLTDVNEKPEADFEAETISEGAAGGSVVGILTVADPENGNLDCNLSAESAKLFRLVYKSYGIYEVVVRDGVSLDYESATFHNFKMTLSDGTNSVAETVAINLTDVNEKSTITFTSVKVNEHAGSGSIVGRLTAVDPEDDDVTYTLNSESSQFFNLVENEVGGYDVEVRQGVRLNYETPIHHQITLTASDGENSVRGNFTINMIDGIDVLTGTKKADNLNGTAGRDIIKGFSGKDILTGGGGQDVFVFDSKPNKKTNLDKVVDFKVVDDSIWLENKIFTKLGKKGSEAAPAQLKKSMFALEKAKDKDDYIIYSKKTGKLSYDVDGSGSKAAVEVATLSKKLAITYKDFFVI